MFLFTSPKGNVTPLGGGVMPMQQKPTLLQMLGGEERSGSMALLLLILTASLHLWLGLWLLQPKPPQTDIEPPKVMEVVLLAAPSPKPASAPPAQARPQPPKKPPVKKAVKKNPQPLKKPTELPRLQPVIEEKLPSLPVETPVKAEAAEAKPVSKPAAKTANEQSATDKVVSGVVALVRVQPKYPSRAVSRHIEGWVKIEFTITTEGTVTDAIVVVSEPAEIFDYEALKAIKKWKFKEKIVNGVAAEQRAVQTLQFKLID